MLGDYDSPTFLGSKDKILMGMTITQLGAFMGSAFFWLLMAFSLDMPMAQRLLIFLPAHIFTTFLLLVRINGLMVPMYLMLMVQGMLREQLCHSHGKVARGGLPEWIAQKNADPELRGFEAVDATTTSNTGRGGGFIPGSVRTLRDKASQSAQSREANEARSLAKVAAEQKAGDLVYGMKRSVRDVFRLVFRSA